MEILGIIPARGGSKGIPKKNIKILAGKPLLCHVLTEALKSTLLSNVVVSSDDDEILSVARGCGGERVLLKRPKELAEDSTPDVPVLQHAVNATEDKEGKRFDYVVQLHATTPLMTSADIDGCIQVLLDVPEADSSVSVYAISDFKPAKIKKIVNNRLVQYFPDTEERTTSRRQDAVPAYRRNAGIYVAKRHVVMEEGRVWGDHCVPYRMSGERSVDINEPVDFIIAEAMIQHLQSLKDSTKRTI